MNDIIQRIRARFAGAPAATKPAAAPLAVLSQTQELRVGVSISRKLNLGNYESAEVWVSLTNIDASTTPAEIEAALAAGALGYTALKAAVAEKVKDVRQHAADH